MEFEPLTPPGEYDRSVFAAAAGVVGGGNGAVRTGAGHVGGGGTGATASAGGNHSTSNHDRDQDQGDSTKEVIYSMLERA